MAFLLTDLKNRYVSLRGFHTNRHLVIIESDDWGSIRMPSHEVFVKLQKLGDHPENDCFLSNDCLESEKDLLELYKVLESVKDSNGKHAIITANFAVANPDFKQIDLEKKIYCYESITDTYKRYYPGEDVFNCVKKGFQRGVFIPQLHCREHLNVNRWMKALSEKKSDVCIAFDNEMIGINSSFSNNNLFGYMDSFNTVESSNSELSHILSEADSMFNSLFGFRSKTFVASCFVWNDALEDKLKELGYVGIQSSPWQYYSVGEKGNYKLRRKLHYTGEKNKFGQFYTVRNCEYEPAYNNNSEESVKKCLADIELSFRNKKPAIITSHRLNYISEINPQNAADNLKGLQKLLECIINDFPDVEFISSPELISIMERSNNL